MFWFGWSVGQRSAAKIGEQAVEITISLSRVIGFATPRH
jgi:hypothetical protein